MDSQEKCVGRYYANFPMCKATREDDIFSCQGRQACQRCLGTMALTDGLTGMGNRFKRQGDFNGLVERGLPFGAIQFDIVNFKFINDTFGHDFGDEILVATAKFLDGQTRAYDMVSTTVVPNFNRNNVEEDAVSNCRPGGDEFTALVPLISKDTGLSVENPAAAMYIMADRLKQNYLDDPIINDYNLRDEVVLSEKTISLRAGVAVYEHGQELNEFLALADPKGKEGEQS